MAVNVMIVEDEAVTGLALEEAVERLGYRVAASVTTGEEAITVAKQEHLDVVLMDIRLRGVVDGITAAERIRKDVHVPCVYLTAYSDDATLGRAKVSEPYGYLVKPFNERELRAAIEIALHHGSMERERRAAQEALEAREQTLQDIVDHSAAIIYLKDAEGRYTLVNRRFEAVLGVSRAEVRGKETRDTFPEETARALDDEDERVLKDGVPRESQVALAGPDGPRQYVALRFPLRRPSGVTYGVCGVLTDVTEVLRIEEELRRAEERSRMLAEGSGEIITATLPDGRVHFVSPACRRILGYGPEEIEGHEGFRFIHPDDVDRLRAMRLPEGETSMSLAFRLRRKDGEYIPVEATARRSPHAGPDGAPLVLSVTRDVSERHRAAEEMRQLNDRMEARVAERTRALQAVNAQLQAFTQIVSHDLRAPARGITYLAAALKDEYARSLDERGVELLDHLNREGARLSALVKDLLEFSRATSATVQRGRVDLTEMAHEVVARLRADAPERAVDVAVAPGLVADCDGLLVRLVLENLLSNAWKFTSKAAAARIELGVSPLPTGERAYFVRDNGAGFDAAHATRLFQPFSRLHAASDFPGTGLGLASAQAIVQQHGGRIWAEGSPGRGATFWFTLGRPG